jgi:hypothetical protein
VANFTIREATPADFDSVLALWFSIDRHTALPDKPEYLQQFLDFAPDLFLVAEAGGRVAGTIIGGWDGWRGHIARLATDPALRRTANRTTAGLGNRDTAQSERRSPHLCAGRPAEQAGVAVLEGGRLPAGRRYRSVFAERGRVTVGQILGPAATAPNVPLGYSR